MPKIYNFSAGPAVLPESVLQTAQQEMLDYNGTGFPVMTLSHRSDIFLSILHHAEQDLRQLLNIPNNYKILFMQGGGSTLRFNTSPNGFHTTFSPCKNLSTIFLLLVITLSLFPIFRLHLNTQIFWRRVHAAPSTIIWQPRLSRIMMPATTFQAAFNGAMAARRHFAPLENQLLRPTYRA
nr:aminotransferase class V-fold PLP-dependent enzyme [Kingella negevensis]